MSGGPSNASDTLIVVVPKLTRSDPKISAFTDETITNVIANKAAARAIPPPPPVMPPSPRRTHKPPRARTSDEGDLPSVMVTTDPSRLEPTVILTLPEKLPFPALPAPPPVARASKGGKAVLAIMSLALGAAGYLLSPRIMPLVKSAIHTIRQVIFSNA